MESRCSRSSGHCITESSSIEGKGGTFRSAASSSAGQVGNGLKVSLGLVKRDAMMEAMNVGVGSSRYLVPYSRL